MSNADYIPGGRFTLDLPFPVSVNKTRRIDWSTRHRTASWLRAADSLVLMQKPLLKAPAAFELQLLIERELRQRAKVEEVLATHDVVDPLLGDFEFAQVINERCHVIGQRP